MKNQKNLSENSEVKSGSKKTKFYFAILLVGILMAGAGIYRGRLHKDNSETTSDMVKDEGADTENNSNYLEGFLSTSEDALKGNLKLSSGDRVIYLRTARDFTALIGSEVLVLIDGTLENFKLVDIQSKIEKDGFIKSQ